MRRLMVLAVAMATIAAACSSTGTTDTVTPASTAPADTAAPAATQAPTTAAPTTAAPSTTTTEAAPTTLRVPADYPTIQEAVDAARAGDLVLIAAGVYHEAVVVETPNLVIRGEDRNEVILDGEHDPSFANGFIVFEDGVAIENLTTQNYLSNGVFFTGDYASDFILHGYRASYITALNNGLYGIYAFNAEYGLIEQSYASGNPDSGYYVGQCQPCNVLITDVIAENNALGYSGTNSGGNLYIVNSEWMNNRVGIVPNTLDSEELAPQRNTTIAGNWVHNNGNPDTPLSNPIWDLAFGGGIVIAGGLDNLVDRNLVTDNPNVGIAISLFPGDEVKLATGNSVLDNVVSGSVTDLAVLVDNPDDGADGNCFAGNTFDTSLPVNIETVAACDGTSVPLGTLLDIGSLDRPGTTIDYKLIPTPGPQPNMPDALTAPARPADVLPEFDNFDLAAITVPRAT